MPPPRLPLQPAAPLDELRKPLPHARLVKPPCALPRLFAAVLTSRVATCAAAPPVFVASLAVVHRCRTVEHFHPLRVSTPDPRQCPRRVVVARALRLWRRVGWSPHLVVVVLSRATEERVGGARLLPPPRRWLQWARHRLRARCLEGNRRPRAEGHCTPRRNRSCRSFKVASYWPPYSLKSVCRKRFVAGSFSAIFFVCPGEECLV